MSLSDWILSSLLLVFIVYIIYYIFKGRVDNNEDENDVYSISYLCDELKRIINSIINMDIESLNLNKKDLENRKALKRSLSDAVRKCSQGDIISKMIVYARAKSTIANFLGITEEVIHLVIPFDAPDNLSAKDKFEIMMYLQKRDGNNKMFKSICEVAGLDKLKKDERGYSYSVTDEDIHEAFKKLYKPLSYDDKLNILTQRVYEETYGLSAVDLMVMEDTSLDGISGGISGITKDSIGFLEEDAFFGSFKKNKTHESIWIIYQGKPIHLAFLSFESKSVLIRICKNIAEHGRSGHLTSSEGGIKTHLADGSRVTVFRPNNAMQWAFFIRKFGSTAYFELKDLITGKGNENPINVIKWAIKGCTNLLFSGDQNSGKTTLTRAAVKEIDNRQPIRTIEADFELYLNDAYADKNILGTRPSERLPFPKLIELIKSTDAHTVLFGETASLEHAKHLIDLLLAGTKRIITTGHWPTSDECISYFVHAMGAYGSSGSEDVESMVSRLINIDVHCVKDNEGNRYIDRITEIIPYSSKEPPKGEGVEGKLDEISHYLELLARKKTYYTRDIVVYNNGDYKMINPISERLSNIIIKNLPPDERQAFMDFNKVLGGGEEAC